VVVERVGGLERGKSVAGREKWMWRRATKPGVLAGARALVGCSEGAC
jgi:hypothetical protein